VNKVQGGENEGSHEKLKRDFGAAAAEKRLNSNLNNFFSGQPEPAEKKG